FTVCQSVFHAAGKKFSFQRAASHTIHRGTIGSGESMLDEVLVSIFRNPHSYTGEDVVEISCHGSVYIQQKILELLMAKGLRMASPGEFTFRAFLNGKMDLSEAEAVADLIASHSYTSHDLALKQLRGGFSSKIKELREKFVSLTALLELELDFSEEDVEFADRKELLKLLLEIKAETELLIKSFSIGNVIRNGVPVAIIGKPNVGKSTLLNAILNEEKAIVSEIPGTTRDMIEDTIVIGGYSFRFIDTAGLREARGKIEALGIEKTREKIEESVIILYVFDATTDSSEEVLEAVKESGSLADLGTKKLILIGNKTDKLKRLPAGFKDFVEQETLFVSAKRKENIHLISESLLRTVSELGITGTTVISSVRHLEALRNTLAAVDAIQQGLDSGISTDLLTTEIRKALYHLGEITGEITTDEILSTIFSRFCIGK
ncbi:MAG TPA: tRNA uridine-5-carboxymethylaminomethyl(34) synthesis GTPase MnmE, partial [Bacteroidales bacterium]|nr:tRNA uridine-5-carboxymethylaminomethyl(34) synthesis GTPase MnmE [Bacteroidales bacterium]